MQDLVVDRIVAHLVRVAADGVPEAARRAAMVFVADSLGVGIAGAATPWRAEVLDMAATSGGPGDAAVWGSGERLPLAAAAMVNAYQMHGLEFDCVHEGAVVHAISAVLPCLVGWAERQGSTSGGIAGETLLRAVIAGVDVAVTLGLCSRAPMRFFRPANCSGFGAVAGLALLAGLDEGRTRDALGIYYGQCAGTMQAHQRGEPAISDADGFRREERGDRHRAGARAACPAHMRRSPASSAISPCSTERPTPPRSTNSAALWRVCEVSHKPFPSGRATHGGIDGLQRLIAAHGIAADRVQSGRFLVPPLTRRLVGRPAPDGMTVAYARLCLSLCRRSVPPARHGRARRFQPRPRSPTPRPSPSPAALSCIADDNPDPNTLHPVRVELDLADGRTVACDVAQVLGSPARPLSLEAARAKFEACCAPAALWDAAMTLDTAGNAANSLLAGNFFAIPPSTN